MSNLADQLKSLNIEPYRGNSYDLRLDLNYRNLASIPDQVFGLSELQWLNLNVNRLKTLQDNINKLKRLKWLFLENNRFEEFPSIIGELEELVKLSLSGNMITKIPSVVGQLRKLTFLDLSDNKLTEFPPSLCMGEMRGIEKLFLGNNMIKNIPEGIEILHNLKVLWLNGNKLEWLPNSISNIGTLEELRLDDNSIRVLPACLANSLSNLKKCRVEGNPLIKPYKQVFSSKKALKELAAFEKTMNSEQTKRGRMRLRRNTSGNDIPCYVVDNRPCGAALVIYNYNYNIDSEEEQTRHSRSVFRAEIRNIRDKLTSCGFSVRLMENLTSLDLIGALRYLSLEDHSFHDCLLVCVLSQGTYGRVMGVDHVGVSFRTLTEIFTEENSPSLAGKPKIFLVQTHPIHRPPARNMLKSPSIEDDLMAVMSISDVIPDEADFLLGCTNLGLREMKTKRRHSISYFKSFAETLEELNTKFHILDVLSAAHRTVEHVASDGDRARGLAVTPVLQSTLRYSLYFGDGHGIY